ncbi:MULTISPECIES: L-fucose:H+ symporter permease [unclassified Imperialibacter]|uniref:L-fucose:H+ symporter permease n=1 Tax=unclassified Imperialibacter TaxID=2629706 RepID=UPI0012572866|nr:MULTISPECIES: L-fucose:H+ symporter permease [unclassified Imperialibacter]CAD5251976.1 L-fucose permease [Imperialibacter sp. 75]CAD5298085.1 L-fucose permease [Imperialibacter sp. 89]VVT13321.1 L-fucose permease [Imperialibacter sp. EC-SDR9]
MSSKQNYTLGFVLVTSLFFLWGFPNDLTNPMVEVFKNVLNISNVKASYVQLAFYGGYGTMAIPAALFIRKYSYKSSIILGLFLFMLGSLLMYPSALLVSYNLFLVSFYILTFGLAFLETTANPMILELGPAETATQRLNLSQAFNPIGALTGQVIARIYVVDRLDTKIGADAPTELLSLEQKQQIIEHDLSIVSTPYIILGFVVLAIMILFMVVKIDDPARHVDKLDLRTTFKKLFSNKDYYEGVLAQFFYVACQIMVWTFIYQYVTNLNESRPVGDQLNATVYVVASTILFLTARWICTFLFRYINSARLMLIFAMLGSVLCIGAILINGMVGLYCLVGVSFAMSLMFPTIYGIALRGMGDEAKLGSAGLILAIVGGALMPPLQGSIIDWGGTGLNDLQLFGHIPEVNFSFILPLFCLLLVAVYCLRVMKRNKALS